MPGPILFLDVDGTLLPFGGNQRSRNATGNPLLNRLDLGLGPHLARLPCELIWATTWMGEANEVLSPLLGLPALPVMDWPDEDEPGPVHWKTRGLVEHAAGRTFVWLDDEITDADRHWVEAHHPGRALLHRVDPSQGLRTPDVVAAFDWLTAVHQGAP